MAVTSFLITTNPQHGTLSGFNTLTGQVTYTPNSGFVGEDTFSYSLFCDGVFINTATVTVHTSCSPVGGGVISGNTNATIGINETYTITGLSGLGPFTYNHVVTNGTIVSGQGTPVIVVTPTNAPLGINTTITNCSGANSTILTKTVNVKVNCTPIIPIKFKCFVPTAITGTLQGILEPDRIISWDQNSIKFRAKAGLHNYHFIIVDEDDKEHTMILKNIHC